MLSQIENDIVIPEIVVDNPIFKVLSVSFWSATDELVSIDQFGPLFKKDAIQRKRPSGTIPSQHLFYWFYIAQYVFFNCLTLTIKVHSTKKYEDLANSEELNYAHDLYKAVLERVDNTEVKNNRILVLCQFDFLFCKYLLSGDPMFARKMYDIFMRNEVNTLPFQPDYQPLIEDSPKRAFDLLITLLQIGENDKALNVIDVYPQPHEPFVLLFKAHALEGKGMIVESFRFYKLYLAETTKISEIELNNFLDIITKFSLNNQEVLPLLEISTNGKYFENPAFGLILTAFILHESKEAKEEIVAVCDTLSDKHREGLTIDMRGIIAFLYFNNGHSEKAINILSDQVNFDVESSAHKVYILALNSLNRDFPRILNLLKNWRLNLPPDSQLLNIEIDIQQELRNHTAVEEIARKGLSSFPNDKKFIVRLIDSLHWQDKVSEVQSLIKSLDIKNLGISWQASFHIANICFLNDMFKIGLDIYYNTLKNELSNPIIYEAYFTNLTGFPDLDKMPYPSIAEKDTVVRIQINNKESVVELTSHAIQYLPLGKALLNKKLNDEIVYHDKLSNENKNIKLLQILDKYRGQFAIYAHKITVDPESAVHLRSEPIDNENPNEFLERMQKRFGADGTYDQIIRDSYIKKFGQGEIGFSELYRHVFEDNPINAWKFVTSNQSDGFRVLPLGNQPAWNLPDACEFVLDFSTLITIYEISKSTDIQYNSKPFIISQVLKDYLKNEYKESSLKRRSYLSVGFTEDKITSYFLSDEQIDAQIQLVKDIYSWTDKYCLTDFAPERLSIERDPRMKSQNSDIHKQILMDTVLLASKPNRILLSDDLIFADKTSIANQMTLENYLYRVHSGVYSGQIIYFLIGWNYRGLTLQSKHVYQCFEKNKLSIDTNGVFRNALHSLSIKYNPDPKNIFTALEFLRDLYSDNLQLDYKRQVSSSVLQYLLVDFNLSPDFLKGLDQIIDILFSLLGERRDYIKDDLSMVVEILVKSKNDEASK